MTRGMYLYDLAATANVPPAAVDAVTVSDFVVLVAGIDAVRAAHAKAAARGG